MKIKDRMQYSCWQAAVDKLGGILVLLSPHSSCAPPTYRGLCQQEEVTIGQ